jgi:UDP-N-acetylmuramoyl-tripeptide--D-alanyl-D-alanine ligase
MTPRALWSTEAMATAMRARGEGPLPAAISGISIDTRTLERGEAFFAIRGDSRDGHEFVAEALRRGAALAVVASDKRSEFAQDAPLLVVPDVLGGLRDLARAARTRTNGKVIGVTGSVGKTGTKEALRLVLSRQGATHASAASYNNHWGVPLSLARCPQEVQFAVFEMGMNHAGEIEPLTKLARPHIAIITAIEPVHLEYFGSLEAIADAKAEIFAGVEPGGAAIINRDNPQYGRLRQQAGRQSVGRIVSFGAHEEADARLIKVALLADCSTVQASILGHEVTFKIGAPGRHLVINSLAVLAAASLAGADLALAALALAELQPPAGRGARIALDVPGGAALLIDESYNANPASMRAAIAILGQAPIGARGRRIAVLACILEHAVDLVFCSGPLMHALWDALPSERRGGYAETSAALESQVIAAIRPGDAVMVKGSLGSRMGPIVKALERRYPRQRAPEQASA